MIHFAPILNSWSVSVGIFSPLSKYLIFTINPYSAREYWNCSSFKDGLPFLNVTRTLSLLQPAKTSTSAWVFFHFFFTPLFLSQDQFSYMRQVIILNLNPSPVRIQHDLFEWNPCRHIWEPLMLTHG